MPTYLVRLAQAHESFRKVELQALADLAGVDLEFVKYEEDVGDFLLSSLFVSHACYHTSPYYLFTVLVFVLGNYTYPNLDSLHTVL
jgi:tRNA G10  N-methylase Trm11